MSNYNTDYKFSPRVREIIEARRGSKMELGHAQTEMLIKDVFKGKYKGDYKFSDKDKDKILFYLADFTPNSYDKDELNDFTKFLNEVFNKKEVVDFVTKVINNNYHPGMVIYQVRVLNSIVTHFISLFPNYFKMYKGIIINSKFIGDIKKVYPDVKFNTDTAEITDELVDEKINEFINTLKSTHGRKLKVSVKDGIYVIATTDELVGNDLSTYNLNLEDIPKFFFKWE